MLFKISDRTASKKKNCPVENLSLKLCSPPYANPAPGGVYAMPQYYLYRSADMSTGNNSTISNRGMPQACGAKARIAGDLKERSY
jgi:hypothetical protein